MIDVDIFGFLFLIFLIHTVGDFVIQTDWMALNKSKSWRPLLAHTSVYSLCYTVLLLCAPWKSVLAFILFTFGTHTLTDMFTSKLSSYYWAIENRKGFWITIGFDQLAHIGALLLAVKVFLM